MSKIPMDVITDILLQLPAKTLMSFRPSSKPWRSLIDCKDFIKTHLDRSIKTGSNWTLLLRGALHLYSVELDSLDTAEAVDHPMRNGGFTEVFGSCNGLIGLSNSEFDIAICNLSTMKIHRLPVSPIDFPDGTKHRGYVFYGFGYDSVHDDYKILRMVQFKRDEEDDLGFFFPYEVKLYSLKSDSWKKIKTLHIYLHFLFYFYYHILFRRGYGVQAGNHLHWVLPTRPELVNRNVIIGFDLANEKFHDVPEPDYGSESKEFQMDLGVLNGCLCLLCNYNQKYVDIWMMKEYGVKESWTKLHSIQRPKTLNGLAFVRPLVYSKDGAKILFELNNRKLVWYDIKRKKLNTVRIKGSPDSFSAEVCIGSLVPLGTKVQVDKDQRSNQKEISKGSQKKRDEFLSEGFKLVL